MSDSKPSNAHHFSGDSKTNGDCSTDGQQMEPILKRLESIDSKVSALNERDIENQRLLARLRQVETNFKLLYHTSRSEIANLKRNLRKDSSNSNTNRLEKLPNLDPRRPISKSDLIACLHSTSSVTINYNENSTNSSRRTTTRRSSTISSSSGSSSMSSSSSDSSPLSSDSSQHRSRSRPQQKHLQQHPPQDNQSHFNLSPEASCSRPSAKITKHLDSRPIRKREEAETKHASTAIENDVAAHLMRLVIASIRNAREHHAYSVRNAPPSRGHIPNAEEQAQLESRSRDKSVMNPHRQGEKSSRSSNSAISPSKASAKKLQSTSPHLKVPSGPKTPEERIFEEEYGEEEIIDVNISHEKGQQDRKAEVEVITEEESASGGINETFNNHADSPQIDIEEDVSDVDSHIGGDHGEAMSEGEVNDEVDDDTMGEDYCRVEANRNNHSKLQHRSLSRQQDRSRKHHPELVRYETSRGRRKMPPSREHRPFYRNDDSTASPRSLKRTRHLDDEPYARPPIRRPRSDRSSSRRSHFVNPGSRICRNRAVSPVVYRTSAHRPFTQRH